MHRERGAVMVEMAIVVPIFILLLFGMLEFGLAFKDKLAMAHAVSRATRDATVQGNEDIADKEILEAFKDGLAAAASIDSVVHVDIFRADADGSPVVWDRYQPDDTACGWNPCPATDPGPAVYGNPSGYPPCARDTALDPSDGVDTIGVQVRYTHSWVTGVLGYSDQTWHETARGRMEPKRFGAEDPSC
jgi:Flp pilus assembly protein TadG